MEISREYYDVILKRLNGRVAEIKRNKKIGLEQGQKTIFDLFDIALESQNFQ